MKRKKSLVCVALLIGIPCLIFAQTRKPLTNGDIVTMTRQGFESSLIIKLIQASDADFDISPQALINLKSAGVDQSVMEAMLTAQAGPSSVPTLAAHGAVSASVNATPMDPTKPVCSASACLLKEGTEAALKFESALSSKTAVDDQPIEFVLDDDLKVGNVVVVAKGAHAIASVTDARKAGMMGRGGELDVQLQYLSAGDNHIRIRGTKEREGNNKMATMIALTVLFGPIGLIKHGKNVEIPAGTPLTAYIDHDIWLPPLK